MKSTTRITYRNDAFSHRKADIVIFQKDGANGSKIFAWRVIHNCQYTYMHDFDYIAQLDLLITDCYGNQKLFVGVHKGHLYTFSYEDGIVLGDEAINPERIEVQNKLSEGTISASLQRSHNKIYEKAEICPEEYISFDISDVIYVARADAVIQGQVLCERFLKRIATPFCLENIQSADLVLKGGGFGPTAKKYCFVLENIVNK